MRYSLKYTLVTWVLTLSAAWATTINVPDDYSTIQEALTAADSSDTVLVQPDTYYENVIWPDVNGIKLISAGDSSNTVIDGSGNGRVIYMNPSTATIDSTTEIQGFRITNGGNIASGGGMFVSNASPVLTRLWITGNTATTDDGGGLYIYSGSPTLTDVTVTGNTATDCGGGGLYIYSGSTTQTLTDLTVTGNTAYRGGGLSISGGSSSLTDGTVTGNTATEGGGLYSYYSSSTLTRITVSRNLGAGLYFRGGSGALVNVTITGNTSGIYVESGTPTIARSNIAYHGIGLYNADNTNTVDADTVWWGDSSGPYHPLQNPGGLGDSVNAFVNVTPWLTEPDTAAPPIPVQNITIDSTGYDFVELSWDASPIGDLTGYRVYFDTDSSGFPYTDTIDVGNNTLHTLSGLMPGLTYYIAATCYDTDGNESWYSDEVSATPTALAVEESSGMPTSFALHQAYPNPFNPSSTLRFDLPEQSEVALVVYDIMGREIIRLVNSHLEAGYHRIVWDAKDRTGRSVPSGIYIARMLTPEFTKSIKMVLLK